MRDNIYPNYSFCVCVAVSGAEKWGDLQWAFGEL